MESRFTVDVVVGALIARFYWADYCNECVKFNDKSM